MEQSAAGTASPIKAENISDRREAMPERNSDGRFKGRREQPLPIRVVHWCNAVFIFLMAGSGLQILAAYPSLGPQGAQYAWYPFQGVPPPSWLRLGGWLAGGRHWHFAMAWFFFERRMAPAAFPSMARCWQRDRAIHLLHAHPPHAASG
jgi:thiosulfate reductase cytochrome b subunit